MSGSYVNSRFAQHALVQTERIFMGNSGDEWEMSDSTMMHLFAQERHIKARMTVSTNMSEIGKMVASRSKCLNFQMALGCAVMIEWCYMREMAVESEMSDLPKEYRVRLASYYGRLGEAWDKKYEIAKKFYNAPIARLCAEMDEITLPTDEPEMPVMSDSSASSK